MEFLLSLIFSKFGAAMAAILALAGVLWRKRAAEKRANRAEAALAGAQITQEARAEAAKVDAQANAKAKEIDADDLEGLQDRFRNPGRP